MTSHPRNATPSLFEAIRDLPSACEQLHLPVQAGDNELLRRMRRVYTVEHYTELIERARGTVADLAVTTDIIVGFSGETEAEFRGTEELIRNIRFDTVHLAAYSVRPGTAAARRPDDVPLDEKKARLNHLLGVQREIAASINAGWVGRTVSVLVEGVAEDGRGYGRSRQGKVCWVTGPNLTAGDEVDATVVASTAWQLEVQATAAPA